MYGLYRECCRSRVASAASVRSSADEITDNDSCKLSASGDDRISTPADEQSSQVSENEVTSYGAAVLASSKDERMSTPADEVSGHKGPPVESKQRRHGADNGKSGSEAVAAASATHALVDNDVEDIVKDCWRKIEDQRQCELAERRNKKVSDGQSRGWKTIRVFVSSTFTDMHSEREILIKKVICVALMLYDLYYHFV